MKLFKNVCVVESQVLRRRRDGSSVSLEPRLLSDLLGAYGGDALIPLFVRSSYQSSMVFVPGGLAGPRRSH